MDQELYTQPSKRPTRKVLLGNLGGALVAFIVSVASWLGVEIPIEVSTSAVVLVGFAVSYFVKDTVQE